MTTVENLLIARAGASPEDSQFVALSTWREPLSQRMEKALPPLSLSRVSLATELPPLHKRVRMKRMSECVCAQKRAALRPTLLTAHYRGCRGWCCVSCLPLH